MNIRVKKSDSDEKAFFIVHRNSQHLVQIEIQVKDDRVSQGNKNMIDVQYKNKRVKCEL